MTFYDLDLILFGEAISLATGIFLCSVQSSAFISIQCDDVILEFPLFTMNKLQSLCNDVNSTQAKPYSLRKTKALNKKLKKLNLPLSVNINFKDSNKCAILDFTNSAHYTGALHLFKESYPIKEITDVDGVLVEVTAALESPRVRVHWYLTQDRCMFQGPAGEVASFTEEFLHSLSNSQFISNGRNLTTPIDMYDQESSSTDVFSLRSQFSTKSSPMQLKDACNVSLHQTHSEKLKFLNKKVAAFSNQVSTFCMPSMNNNYVSMDALVQFKNSIKADFIDLRNSINAFEVDLERQNNTIQSLSEIIKKQETSKIKTDKKIAELQKEIKRLTSPSSTSTSPRLTSPKDVFNSASANCNSSPSSSSNVPKSLQKSSLKLPVHHHQTPIIHSTIINRCPRNTLPHRHQGNTVDRLPPDSQFDQNTPSPGTGSSTPYKDALMSSKGIIGVKRRYLSHSQPTSSNHIQATVCSHPSKPIPKNNFKHFIFGDSFVRGIHAGVMSTSDEEKVEIFSWSGVRMEHLIDKISNVPQDSLVKKVTIHAGINDSKFKISISSSTLSQLLKLLHAKFPNVTEIAFSSIVPPAGRGVCLNYSFKNNETIESFCKSKNIIFINNYSSFLTANGAPKKRFYGDFLSFTKLGFSMLAKNIKWRRNSSSINSASNPSPVNSIELAKLAPSTSKPTNNSLISKELREAFMQLFTSFLDSHVS